MAAADNHDFINNTDECIFSPGFGYIMLCTLIRPHINGVPKFS